MKTLIRNIGQLVTGDLRQPLADADSLAIRDGRIAAVGRGLDEDADLVIDARGTTVMPGLIDSHVHPVFGDFTPRQRTVDFLDSGLNGGVTTAISAGEVHLPGRPRDVVGLKALAIVAAKAWANFRPGGVKVHAGAPILELGLTEGDFKEMAAAGVKLVGEIGLGSVKTGRDAAPMVRWAKQLGMTVTIHTGGPSIAGSSAIGAEMVLEAQPHVVGHINGGTTSMAPAEIERLVATDMALEIVQCGNARTALHTLRVAREQGALGRVIVGNDAPSIQGVTVTGDRGNILVAFDLDALAQNVRTVTSRVGPDTAVLAVCKADAYGHGAVEVGSALAEAGTEMLGVATVEEAAEQDPHGEVEHHVREGEQPEQSPERDRPRQSEADPERRHRQRRQEDPERPVPERVGDRVDRVRAEVVGQPALDEQRERGQARPPHPRLQRDPAPAPHPLRSPRPPRDRGRKRLAARYPDLLCLRRQAFLFADRREAQARFTSETQAFEKHRAKPQRRARDRPL